MPEVQINGGNVLITLAIILIVLEGLSVLSKGVDAFKKLTGKDERAREMRTINERLGALEAWKTTVESRFQQGNNRFAEAKRDSTEILKTLHRIVKHLQSGNDHQKLQQTDDQLYEYLLERGVSRDELE